MNFVIDYTQTVLEFVSSMTGHVLSWPVAFLLAVLLFRRPIKALIGRVKSGKIAGVEFNVADVLIDADAEATDAAIEARSKRDEQAPASAAGGDTPGPVDTPEAEDAVQTPTANEVPQEAIDRAAERLENSIDAEIDRAVLLDLADRLELSIPGVSVSSGSRRAYPLATVIKSWNALAHTIDGLTAERLPTAARRLSTARKAWELNKLDLVDESFVSSVRRLQEVRNKVVHGDAEITSNEAHAFYKTATRLRRILEEEVAPSVRPTGPTGP